MSGLSKNALSDHEAIGCSLWVYSIKYNKWVRAEDPGTLADDADMMDVDNEGGPQPLPRFAHQTLYDPLEKKFFMFGGNDRRDDGARLGDFWELQLDRYVRSLCERCGC